ncbi:MAG: UDP-N-acetylglucosamine 2-epimerase (non-hydrolyzing) [Acidobacteriota bacterium]
MKIFLVAGARPNFVKIAALVEEFRRSDGANLQVLLIHTGQHYSRNMSGDFFTDLGIPEPDINLGVGSGSHAEQTARIMVEFEKICIAHRPDWVMVVGDVNSTLACAVTAKKLGIKVAHVEAGLRSRDMSMPEEINRVCTDAVSDLLFTTDQMASENLRNEGVSAEKILFVGNTMIDTLLRHIDRARALPLQDGLSRGQYAVLTLHRPSNVDDKETLSSILTVVASVADQVPFVFPAHPRTRKLIEGIRLHPRVRITEPLGYLSFLGLVANAKMVLTDSGGIQEETTVLGIPCLTLRANTERPITCQLGTNCLVGTDPNRIRSAALAILNGHTRTGAAPEKWDGRAAERIVEVMLTGSTSPQAGSPGAKPIQPARAKVLTLEKLAVAVRAAQQAGKRVAHCHGCFDILHCGHLRHFEAARGLADILVVTVTPDAFVRKGPNRPVFPGEQRAEVLAGLRSIDWVAINRWDSAVETIRLLRPNAFVKGEEYETRAMQVNPNFIAEAEAVRQVGGDVAFTRELTLSSTAAFQKVAGAREQAMSKTGQQDRPRHFDAVVFDLDGILTDTAKVHAAAWKSMFDEYLRGRAAEYGEQFRPFDLAADYRSYVDGKPRYDGVRSFLLSRGIELPEGHLSDGPDAETVCGLGNRKDRAFNDVLTRNGVEVFESSVRLVHELGALGVARAVSSSSKNCRRVLQIAGLEGLFSARVDGAVSAELRLKGKPSPDMFLKCAELLRVDPDRCVVVEDAISGVQAGRSAGFGLVIGVDRRGVGDMLSQNGADVVVGDLSEAGAGDIDRWLQAKRQPAGARTTELILSLSGASQ